MERARARRPRDDDEVLRTIGENLRAARLRRYGPRSQTYLARRLGIGQPELSLWEGGRRSPKVIDLVRFAEACGTTPERLFRGVAGALRRKPSVAARQLTLDLDTESATLVAQLVSLLRMRARAAVPARRRAS